MRTYWARVYSTRFGWVKWEIDLSHWGLSIAVWWPKYRTVLLHVGCLQLSANFDEVVVYLNSALGTEQPTESNQAYRASRTRVM